MFAMGRKLALDCNAALLTFEIKQVPSVNGCNGRLAVGVGSAADSVRPGIRQDPSRHPAGQVHRHGWEPRGVVALGAMRLRTLRAGALRGRRGLRICRQAAYVAQAGR